MKYALILPDGAADEPLAQLGGATPLAAARTPHMDWIAANGQLGTVSTVPKGFVPGSDVATLSVLGYDVSRHYTGRAPLEAAAQDIAMAEEDLVFRCNLVTIEDGKMADFSAGHIAQNDAHALITALCEAMGNDTLRFYVGVMYRHLLVIRNARDLQVQCTPPHDIPDQPIKAHVPFGEDADGIIDIMNRAREVLESHPVNQARIARGEKPANAIWLWGQGHKPKLDRFDAIHKIQGACITAVDLIRGIAKLIGWPILPVEGATGYLDTNYQGKGARAIEALDEFDLVAVHIEAPDEAGHNGDLNAKIHAIEQIDQHIVGPILSKLQSMPKWSVMLLPDHPTPVAKRTHTDTPPPFCMADHLHCESTHPAFSEAAAERCNLHINPGYKLMQYFLRRDRS